MFASIVCRLKVNNEIGSNFDSCRLEGRTLLEKYENVICGIISVSSYGLIELPTKKRNNMTCKNLLTGF